MDETAVQIAEPETTVADDEPKIHLIARSAEELRTANKSLIAWVDQRIAFAKADVKVLSENLEHARKAKWKISSIQSLLARARNYVTYYEKIKEALRAGYTLIPNLQVDVFAVRVKENSKVPRQELTSQSRWGDNLGTIAPKQLPAGEGVYVSDEAARQVRTQKEGEKEYYTFFNRPEFQDISFPAVLVHPEVMTASQQAMAARVFDAIGIVNGRTEKKDPLVIGQIIGPANGYSRRTVSFLIAWFIDARSI